MFNPPFHQNGSVWPHDNGLIAAGSTFMFLQTIPRLTPDAPGGKLYLDPLLPDWLGDIVIRDL